MYFSNSAELSDCGTNFCSFITALLAAVVSVADDEESDWWSATSCCCPPPFLLADDLRSPKVLHLRVHLIYTQQKNRLLVYSLNFNIKNHQYKPNFSSILSHFIENKMLHMFKIKSILFD